MSDPDKILLVRVGRAGDLVMVTPALNAILAAFPKAEVHLMTSAEGQRVMRGYHPRVTKTWIYRRRFPHGLKFRLQQLPALRALGYSRVYVIEFNAHYRRLPDGVAPAIHWIEDSRSDAHFCDQCLDLVASSVKTPIERGWVTLPVSDEGVGNARALLDRHGIERDAFLVGLHPTFSGTSRLSRDSQGTKHRVWPLTSFAALARELREKTAALNRPVRVVVDVLPEERAVVEPIVAESGGAVTLLAEAPDFQRYKGFLKCLDVLVTPNTGPMHMAAALGTDVVALFSGWSPSDCGPFVAPRHQCVLRAEDTDEPERGLAAITPSAVAEAVIGFGAR